MKTIEKGKSDAQNSTKAATEQIGKPNWEGTITKDRESPFAKKGGQNTRTGNK